MNTMQPEKRGPGRPPKDSPKREVERRRKKTAMQTPGRLGCNPAMLDHGQFAYRWVNDEPGRIEVLTQQDDWDLVPQSGEKEDSTELGNMVSVVVGTFPNGEAKRAFLARKPKTFYEEDKAAEQAALDEQLEQLRRGNDRQGGAQSDYIPNSGIRL